MANHAPRISFGRRTDARAAHKGAVFGKFLGESSLSFEVCRTSTRRGRKLQHLDGRIVVYQLLRIAARCFWGWHWHELPSGSADIEVA